MRDNRALEARPDVLTFTTPALVTPLEVVGTPVVELAHSRDNRYADVFVRLCDVDPKGRSRNFSDAFVRLDPASSTGEVQRLELRARSVRPPARSGPSGCGCRCPVARTRGSRATRAPRRGPHRRPTCARPSLPCTTAPARHPASCFPVSPAAASGPGEPVPRISEASEHHHRGRLLHPPHAEATSSC